MTDEAIGELVAVIWIDAHASVQSEMSSDEIGQEASTTYISYGKLVRADAKLVAVAADERDDGRYRGITFIPRGMVTDIQPIRPRRKRKAKIAQPPETHDHS